MAKQGTEIQSWIPGCAMTSSRVLFRGLFGPTGLSAAEQIYKPREQGPSRATAPKPAQEHNIK